MSTPHGHGLKPEEARAYGYLRQLRTDYGRVSPDPKVDAYLAQVLSALERLVARSEA